MAVEIKGRNGTKLKRELVTSLILHIVKHNLPRRRCIDVDVNFVSKIADGAEAIVYNEQPYASKPSVFRIDILNDLDVMGTLAAAAHEMAHVIQYATGRLKLCPVSGMNVWEGKPHEWEPSARNPYGGKKYWNLPWEIDAHGRQIGFLRTWMDEENYSVTEGWYVRIL